MSYILEALRRSQAERERGRVPGLDAQLAPPAEHSAEVRASVPWGWWGAGLLAVLLTVMVWWMSGYSAGPAVAGLGPAADGQAPPGGPLASTAPAPAPAPAPATAQAPGAPFPLVVSAPMPATPPAAGKASTTAPLPAPPRSPLRTAAEAPTPTGHAVAEARAIPLAELNAEVRRELPPMAFGGAIWSESPSSRFVMVNGQVVHEGEVAGPGVVVERIGTKAAVLRWRDMRIEVSF